MTYLQHINYYYLFIYFIIFSFGGWLLEVAYHFLTHGKLVNRGFLYGPVCPIYGLASVSVIILLTPFSNNYIILFIGGFLLASLIEFITGFILEKFFKARWWDYTDNKFNIMGYVCLRFSIIWACIAVTFVKLVYPPVDILVHGLPHSIKEFSYNILLVILVADITATVNNLIQFRRVFTRLYDLSIELKGSIDTVRGKILDSAKAAILEGKIGYLKENYDQLMNLTNLKFRRMIKAYPKITSKRFGKIIDEIKQLRKEE